VQTGLPENSRVLAEKPTVPLGVVAVPVSVSVTTASQVPIWWVAITDGHVTEVEVERRADCEDIADPALSDNTAARPMTTATTARTAFRTFPGLLIDQQNHTTVPPPRQTQADGRNHSLAQGHSRTLAQPRGGL